MDKYRRSFEILEKYVPDAKYEFTSGIVTSTVTQEHIPTDSNDGLKLIEMGWLISNEFWSKIL